VEIGPHGQIFIEVEKKQKSLKNANESLSLLGFGSAVTSTPNIAAPIKKQLNQPNSAGQRKNSLLDEGQDSLDDSSSEEEL